MKNEFKIIANGKEQVAHNTVKNAFKYWLQDEIYAAYIAILDKSGNKLYKRAELVSYNDNVALGELYAMYRISVTSGEFPNEVCTIGFAPRENAELANECSVSIIASDFDVYGTVYLQTKNKDFTFYPSENPLVQSLLGMQAVQQIKIKGVNARLPDWPLVVNESDYSEIESTVNVDDGLFVTFDSGGFTDFLVCVGDMACARFNLSYFTGPELVGSIVPKGGFYTGNIAVTKVTSSETDEFSYYNTLSALYESGAEQISGFDGYELFCDPLYRFAGLKNGNDYYIIDSETLTVKYGGEYSGDISMCSNGEVVCVADGKVRFLRSGLSVNVKDGQTVVLYRDGGYDIFVYDTLTFTVYRYENELVETNFSVNVPAGVMTRLSDFGAMIKNDTTALYMYCNGILSSEFDWLNNALPYSVKDWCGYSNGQVCSLYSGVNMECDKHSGRFCLKDNQLFYIGDGGAIKLRDNFEFDSAAIAGSAAMFLLDGNLAFYRIGIDGTFVSLPATSPLVYYAKAWSSLRGQVTLKIND